MHISYNEAYPKAGTNPNIHQKRTNKQTCLFTQWNPSNRERIKLLVHTRKNLKFIMLNKSIWTQKSSFSMIPLTISCRTGRTNP